MDTNSNISSGLLEAYVLGTCSAEEKLQVQELCAKDPMVYAEIEAIERALILYASAGAPEISKSVKENIFVRLDKKTNGASPVLPLRRLASAAPKWYGYAAAVAVVLLALSAVINLILYTKVQNLNSELSVLQQEKTYYTEQLQVQEVVLRNQSSQLAVLSDPNTKMVKLKSTNASADQNAILYWNSNNHQTYISAVQLPAPPAGKQYQLWAIINGEPFDAGVFDTSNGSFLLLKMKDIANAQAFAVTLENAGGSPSPTLTALCLSGNV